MKQYCGNAFILYPVVNCNIVPFFFHSTSKRQGEMKTKNGAGLEIGLQVTQMCGSSDTGHKIFLPPVE